MSGTAPKSTIACELCELNRLNLVRKNLTNHKEKLEELLDEWNESLEDVMDEQPQVDLEYQKTLKSAAEVQVELGVSQSYLDAKREQLDSFVMRQHDLHSIEMELRERIQSYTDVLFELSTMQTDNLQNIRRVESTIQSKFGKHAPK